MPEEIRAWNCSYKKYGCKKKAFRGKGNATQHERRCIYSPAKRACVTCKYFGNELGTVPGSFEMVAGSPTWDYEYGCGAKVTKEQREDYYCKNICVAVGRGHRSCNGLICKIETYDFGAWTIGCEKHELKS